MADPFTLAATSLGTQALGGGISIFGALNKGAAESDMYMYKAQVAQYNSQIAERNAQYEISKGGIDAFNNDLKVRQQLGTGRANIGASGFDISSGSGAQLLESAHDIGRYNTLSIVSDAQRRGYNDRVKAWDYLTQEQMDKSSADNARTTGMLDATSSLLGSASSISDRWSRYQTAGVFG